AGPSTRLALAARRSLRPRITAGRCEGWSRLRLLAALKSAEICRKTGRCEGSEFRVQGSVQSKDEGRSREGIPAGVVREWDSRTSEPKAHAEDRAAAVRFGDTGRDACATTRQPYVTRAGSRAGAAVLFSRRVCRQGGRRPCASVVSIEHF